MRAADAAFQRLLDALALLAGAIFALIALAIPINAVLRAAFAASLYGVLDAVEYGLLAATFLAAPWVLSKDAHVAVDVATLALPPSVRRRLARGVNLLGALLSLVFCWYAFQALALSFARGAMIRTAFTVPEWWVLMAPVVATALLAVEFLRKLARGPRDGRAAHGL